MKYFLFSILSIFILVTDCYSADEGKLQKAEQLMKTNPGLSLQTLKSMQGNYGKMNDEEKALYGLLYFEGLEQTPEEIPPYNYIDFSINYYTKNNQKTRLAHAYFRKAHASKTQRNYTVATQNLFKAKDLLDPEKEPFLLGNIYFDLGQISGYQTEFEKALEYYSQASTYYEKAGKKESLSKTYVVKGWTYMAMNDYDNAIASSKKALTLTSDSIIMGDVMNDIGNGYFYKDECDSALVYMRKSLHYPYFSTNISMRYYNIGNVYSFLENYDSALVYINKAMQYPIDIYIEEECYRVLVRIAIAKDDKVKLPYYISKRQACQDSIRYLEQQPKVSLLEYIHEAEVKTIEVKNQRLILIVATSSLALVGFFIFLLLHKRNKQKQRKADTFKNEHAIVQQEYSAAKIKADIYKTELDKKHELLLSNLTNEIEKTKAKYAEARKKAAFEEREKIDIIIYNEVLHVGNESAFIDKMNKVLNYLPEKLKNDYADISYKEIVWCCLFMLAFSTPDISLILGFKQSTQYKFKQRLCKKLQFANAKELEQMLHAKMNI